MNFTQLYTTFDGRIARREFWIGILGLYGVLLVCFAGAAVVLELVSASETLNLIFVAVAMQLLLLCPLAALLAKRLHDRNKPSYFLWFLLAPSALVLLLAATVLVIEHAPHLFQVLGGVRLVQLVVFWWFVIELGCMRGTVGANRYGLDPVPVKQEPD